jgi:hypothetical protein
LTDKLPQATIDLILKLAGTMTEKAIAEKVGVSRWTVNHYLKLNGKAPRARMPTPPTPGEVVRVGQFSIYYNKHGARNGYPWSVEASDGTVDRAKSVEVSVVSPDWTGPNAWTSYEDEPRRRGGRASYVKGVMVVVGRVVIHQ